MTTEVEGRSVTETLVKHCAMKMEVGVEVLIHLFITSAPD
jgi:hypothetical protein